MNNNEELVVDNDDIAHRTIVNDEVYDCEALPFCNNQLDDDYDYVSASCVPCSMNKSDTSIAKTVHIDDDATNRINEAAIELQLVNGANQFESSMNKHISNDRVIAGDDISFATGERDILTLERAIREERPAFIVNFATGHCNFDQVKLSHGAQLIHDCPNAGGQSEKSEAMSFELLTRSYGAALDKTEMAIEYEWNNYSKKTDYSVKINGTTLGVSVTRARKWFAAQADFSEAQAIRLLAKKLDGVNRSTRDCMGAWSQQILHIFTDDVRVAQLLNKVYHNAKQTGGVIDNDLKNNTIIMVTICATADYIFSNRNLHIKPLVPSITPVTAKSVIPYVPLKTYNLMAVSLRRTQASLYDYGITPYTIEVDLPSKLVWSWPSPKPHPAAAAAAAAKLSPKGDEKEEFKGDDKKEAIEEKGAALAEKEEKGGNGFIIMIDDKNNSESDSKEEKEKESLPITGIGIGIEVALDHQSVLSSDGDGNNSGSDLLSSLIVSSMSMAMVSSMSVVMDTYVTMGMTLSMVSEVMAPSFVAMLSLSLTCHPSPSSDDCNNNLPPVMGRRCYDGKKTTNGSDERYGFIASFSPSFSSVAMPSILAPLPLPLYKYVFDYHWNQL